METTPEERDVALCVDLDGTLVATDLLWESALALARSRPVVALGMPIWLLGGRARLGREIAGRVELAVDALPYRPEVIAFLEREKAAGRRLVLASASGGRFARAVADHLGLFDEVIAGDGRVDREGSETLEALRDRFGEAGFDYVGGPEAGLPLWASARRAIVVHPGRCPSRSLSRSVTPYRTIEVAEGGLRDLFEALRPHQWGKNALLFVPLITAHRLGDAAKLLPLLVTFVALSLGASALYVLNDLLDLAADRRHRSKKDRPFASGRVPIPTGIAMLAALIGLSLAIAASVGPRVLLMILGYMVLSGGYSLYLKSKIVVDVLCLAGLYTYRILIGGVATSIVISDWLLVFSMFLFLSLAFAKRYTELKAMQGHHGLISGRGYLPEDLDLIRSVGPASGYLSVMVFCLYLHSEDVRKLYREPALLWLICPMLIYWISRVWFVAHRGQLADDPVLFVLKDRNSLAAIAASGLILVVASLV